MFLGWTKRVEYTPGSGSIPLFPSLHLETCEETVWNIQATVELQTGHIGKGCDRDSYSDRSVRRLCGAWHRKLFNMLCRVDLSSNYFLVSSGAVRGEVDLLPPPSPAANWTSALPTLPSSDSSLVFSFNGSNHVAVVPDSVVSMLSGDHFTLQLWMRRGGANIQPTTTQSRGSRKEEETIVCSTVKNGVFRPPPLPQYRLWFSFKRFFFCNQCVHGVPCRWEAFFSNSSTYTGGKVERNKSVYSFKVLLRDTLNPLSSST